MKNNPYIESLRPVWQNPQFVFVDERKIEEVAKELAQKDLKIPSWRIPYIQPGNDENWMDYVILVNSINFSYKDCITLKDFGLEYPEGKHWERSYALGAAIIRAYKEGLPIFDADFLESMDKATLEHIFRGNPPLPMLNERLWILKEVGKVLNHRFEGKFINVFKEANGRCFNKGKGLVELLINTFPSYSDRSYYRPQKCWLEFHKRAQLVAIMYQGRALSSDGKLPLLKDYTDIGPIADYQVPRALKYLGILKYEKTLEERIQNQIVIPSDTLEEQEIRVQTVYAMKRLVEEIKVSILEIDYAIWSMGGRKVKDPHHLTPTIAY